MGFDVDRFVNNIDEELRCQICFGVLQDPLQAVECEHTFCRVCINEWLKNSPSCPVDRNQLRANQLQQIPRIVRNLINHLQIYCDFKVKGCEQVVMLEELESHKLRCSFNPEIPIECPKYCGAFVPKNRLTEHDCIRELRDLLCKQQKQISQLIASVNELSKFKEKQQELSLKNSKFFKELTESYNHLELSVNNLEAPIQEILLFTNEHRRAASSQSRRGTNDPDGEPSLEMIQNKLARETTIEIYIKNLNRQITAGILKEYLSKQEIHVINCEESLSNGHLSNYRVTILKSSAPKILVPGLWPKGVECFICSEYYDTKIEGIQPLENFTLALNA